MDWLEQELKSALERKEPAPGFAARVSAAARREQAGSLRHGWHTRRWMALAASVIVLASAGEGYRWRQGVRAKDQVMQAVRIAGGKLNRVQAHFKEVSQ